MGNEISSNNMQIEQIKISKLIIKIVSEYAMHLQIGLK